MSASNEKLYFMHAKKLQIFNLWKEKKCSAGNFVTSAKVHCKIISKYFKPLSEVIQMFDQGRSVKRSITDVTFESFPGKNVSFNSISCLSMNILILFLTKHYVAMPMMTSQILKSADFTKTQKSRYLENVTVFFLQIKKG